MSAQPARRAAAAAATLLLTAAAASAQTPGRPPTVETLAGPGFCEGRTVIDPTPNRVAALAVSPDGRLFTDVPDDPRGRGVVRAVDGTQVTLLRSNEPVGPLAADPLASASGPPAAGRLVAGTREAVVVAAGARLIEIGSEPPSLRSLAGVPATRPPPPGLSSSGDGGPAEDARFTSARSVAADADHNLYVADQIDPRAGTFRVRFINRTDHPVTLYRGTPGELTVPPGSIDTIAGAAGSSSSGDGLPARQAVLQGVPPALDVNGPRLYIATYWAAPGSPGIGSVRLVNLGGAPVTAHGVTVGAGAIQTVAGGPPASRDADGIPARAVALSSIPGIASDQSGGLYIAEHDRDRVRIVDDAGTISTFAGSPESPSRLGQGDLDRPARQARLDGPVDVKVGSGRRVFISDEGSGRVLVVDTSGMVHLALGAGRLTRCGTTVGLPTSPAQGERPEEGEPYSVAVDNRGDTYFVNLRAGKVMKVDRAGTTSVVTAVSANCPPTGSCSSSKGPAIRTPAALASFGDGLYVFDVIGARVLYLNLGPRPARVNGIVVPPRRVGVVAGNGTPGAAGDGGRATDGQLSGRASSPNTPPGDVPFVLLLEEAIGDVAVDPAGDLFIGDAGNARVRMVDSAGVITTIGGSGASAAARDCCTKPAGLAVDPFGNLYVSDLATRQVWFLNRGGQPVSVHGQTVPAGGAAPVAGTGKRGIGGDGRALDIPLYQPVGLVPDAQGNLYFADYHDQTVRRLDRAGNLSTFVGTGAGGFNGDGLPPRQTALFNPTDVALDGCGNLLVADLRNDRLRRVDLAGPCMAVGPGTSGPGRSSSWLWWVAAAAIVVLVTGAGVVVARRRRRAGLSGPGRRRVGNAAVGSGRPP